MRYLEIEGDLSDHLYNPPTFTMAGALLARRSAYNDDARCYQSLTRDEWAWLGLGAQIGTLILVPSTDGVPPTWDEAKLHPKARTMRAGRAVRAVLTEASNARVSDADLEVFANQIKAFQEALVQANTWEVISGTALAEAYGSYGAVASCMQGKDADFFALYAANPTKVEMLVRWQGDCLMTRSLVWHADDGQVYVDRAYGSDHLRLAVRAEARGRGWWKKARDTYEDSDRQRFINPATGEPEDRHITVTLPAGGEYPLYPYLDTLCYLDANQGTVSNRSSRFSGDYLLVNTDGGGGPSGRTCYECDTELDHGEGVRIGGHDYCESCYDDLVCADCGEFHRRTERGYCPGCRSSHTCLNCGDVVDDIETVTGGDGGYCQDCVGAHTCATCDVVTADDLDDDGNCSDCHQPEHVCVVCAEGFDGEPKGKAMMCDSCRDRERRRCDDCALPIPPGQQVILKPYGDRSRRGMALWHHKVVCCSCERDRLLPVIRARLAADRQRAITAGQGLLPFGA